MTTRQIRALSDDAAAEYNERRGAWHANLGPLNTPQLAALHEDLWDILDSNAHDAHKAKGAVAVDGCAGLGKSIAVAHFAKDFHRREVAKRGELTRAGNERWPVCRIGLTGNPSIKDLNRTMLEFFAHPGGRNGTSTQLAERALDCMLACETRLLIIDDLHFLRWRSPSGAEVSNHFKYIANEFPVTLISIGVDLTKRGMFSDGTTYAEAVLAQTGRRTTVLPMRPFTIDDERGRREWRQLLLTIERHIVLAKKRPGRLTDELTDYLFARSSGHIGSLMNLIRASHRAVRTGVEDLTKAVLEATKIDVAADQQRVELQMALDTHQLTTRPKTRSDVCSHPSAAGHSSAR